jgi:hypothetical protein
MVLVQIYQLDLFDFFTASVGQFSELMLEAALPDRVTAPLPRYSGVT